MIFIECLCCAFIFDRAIYFAAYSTAKEKLNGVLEPDSTQVHMVSAGLAGKDGSLSIALVSFSHRLFYLPVWLFVSLPGQCISEVLFSNTF